MTRPHDAQDADPDAPAEWFDTVIVGGGQAGLSVGYHLARLGRSEVRAHGAPLLRVKLTDLAAAGVEHVSARTVAARDGLPTLDDGRALDVANVA
jgi:2-polyprenyl-6-methoxyphenol hydroxylase-like FAD-dependent oxidoreductase